MPLEIKELHVKVSVNPPEGPGASGNGSAPQAKNPKTSLAEREEIIAACIEQVLQILQERKEA